MEITMPLPGKFPFIEVVDYQGGVIYLDDASFSETGAGASISAANLGATGNLSFIGSGSIITDVFSNIFPADTFNRFSGDAK
jgi:hypothetical protein